MVELVQQRGCAERKDAYDLHQRERWTRHDAHLWIRHDYTRWLKPGTDPQLCQEAATRRDLRGEGGVLRRLALPLQLGKHLGRRRLGHLVDFNFVVPAKAGTHNHRRP